MLFDVKTVGQLYHSVPVVRNRGGISPRENVYTFRGGICTFKIFEIDEFQII